MKLTRCAAPHPMRRFAQQLRRWIVVASLIAMGVLGQRGAMALAAVFHDNGARSVAEFEIHHMLDAFAAKHLRTHSCEDALDEFRASNGRSELFDPWEHPYVVTCVLDRGLPAIIVASDGPDCRIGTADDIIAAERVTP